MFFILATTLLVACAGTSFRRNSIPGLTINDKTIVVLVQEYSHNSLYTTKMDSIWNANVKSPRLQAEFVFNEALALAPVDPAKTWGRCADSFLMTIEVTGQSSTQHYDGMGMPAGGSSTVEYTATMYDCNNKKVVWKMILNTNGYEPSSKHELVNAIFNDFKQNNILREK